jgi:hypothetical protein
MAGGTVFGPPSTHLQVRCLRLPARIMCSGTAVTRPDHRGVVLGPHVKKPDPQGALAPRHVRGPGPPIPPWRRSGATTCSDGSSLLREVNPTTALNAGGWVSMPETGHGLPSDTASRYDRHHGKPASYRGGASCHRVACVGEG